MEIILNLSNDLIVIKYNFFQLKTSNKFGRFVNKCYGVTKDPNENDYLLIFHYAELGDLHNNLSKNFKEITWEDKIRSLYWISYG